MKYLPSSKIINLMLLLIVLILAAIAFFNPGLVTKQSIERLTKIESQNITNIRIFANQQSEVVLSKNEAWTVTINEKPIPADEEKITHLLNLVATQSHASFSSPDDELSKYKLDTPKVAIKFDETEIRFGHSEPFSNRRYIYSNDKVHLITDHYYPHLVSPVTEFIDKALVTGKNRVTNIKIVWLQKPNVRLPSQAGIELLQAWQQIRASDIEPYYHQDIIARVLIQTNNSTITEFGLLTAKNTLKLARKDLGIVYTVPKQYMKNLLVFSAVDKTRS